MSWPKWARRRPRRRPLVRALVCRWEGAVYYYSYDRRVARRLARETGVRFRVVQNQGLRSYESLLAGELHEMEEG